MKLQLHLVTLALAGVSLAVPSRSAEALIDKRCVETIWHANPALLNTRDNLPHIQRGLTCSHKKRALQARAPPHKNIFKQLCHKEITGRHHIQHTDAQVEIDGEEVSYATPRGGHVVLDAMEDGNGGINLVILNESECPITAEIITPTQVATNPPRRGAPSRPVDIQQIPPTPRHLVHTAEASGCELDHFSVPPNTVQIAVRLFLDAFGC